jgi:hypothetical protein
MDEMKPYIELVDEASARGRRVIYFLVVATMLVGAAVWNCRPGSWDNREIEVVRFAEKHLGEEPVVQTSTKVQVALFERAKAYLEASGRKWKKDRDTTLYLSERSKSLQRIFEDNYGHFKVPIIGVAFHSNDTDLIGGFGLTVVLLVLRFSLMRERANVSRAFQEAVLRNCVVDTYVLLSMSQVLTVPPGIGMNQISQTFWNGIHKGLFVLPAIVQGSVLYIDYETFYYGWVISPADATLGIVGGGVFFICMLLLIYSCFHQSNATDRIWRLYSGASAPDPLATDWIPQIR